MEVDVLRHIESKVTQAKRMRSTTKALVTRATSSTDCICIPTRLRRLKAFRSS